MSEPWTIRKLIDWTSSDFASRGIDSARLDAEILLAHVLGIERVGLYMDLDRPMAANELEQYRAAVLRRRRREPVAYIVGRRAFYGRLFTVGPDVLVPRPDTETLIDVALQRLPAEPSSERSLRVLDIGTGSGAIALTLAAERPSMNAVATDLSAAALKVAALNREQLGLVDRVELIEGDLFEPLAGQPPFDLIASNPPYIAEEELAVLMPEVVVHEPRLALVADDTGTAVHRRIIEDAPAFLVEGGWLLLEIGASQAAVVMSLLEAMGGWNEIATERDLGGFDRVVRARRG